MNNSTLRVSGGVFGKDNLNSVPIVYRGAIHAMGTSTVKISGGRFGVGAGFVNLSGALEVKDAARLRISGGTFSGDPAFGNGAVRVQSPAATAEISGGFFDGTEIQEQAGLAMIHGCAFNLPFGPVNDLSAALQGILSNGDIIGPLILRRKVSWSGECHIRSVGQGFIHEGIKRCSLVQLSSRNPLLFMDSNRASTIYLRLLAWDARWVTCFYACSCSCVRNRASPLRHSPDKGRRDGCC